jgi:hypothetical protein
MVVSVGSSSTIARRVGGVFAALVCMVALSAGSASAAPKPLPRPVPVAEDALARALAAGRLSPAKYTLERARSLFRLGAVRREFGDVARPDSHAATFILRDLALRLGELPAAERREARRLLARPDDGDVPVGTHGWPSGAPSATACDANVCLHWITDSAYADAPPLDDGPPANGIPDWVETTAAVFANVWAVEVTTMGYRAPKSDASSSNNGGNGKLDVYLADLGADGIFGYCTTDDPNAVDPLFYDFSAYCAVDNDFTEFGGENTPQEFLEVTAAHEFHHASQFAYDATEDIWFMEGDAMWIEGEVYPEIKDRLEYLGTSPLGNPSRALDHGVNYFEYGAWVFFRFLSEHFEDPAVIRDAWTFANASPLGPDQYSMQAVGSATSARGESLASAFTLFTRWNRSPALAGYYDEGADYPTPGAVATYALKPTAPTTGWKTAKLRHLASAHYSLRPGRGTRSTSSVKVTVDLPNLGTKPAATLLVFYKSGAYAAKPITLDSSGNGAKTVAFGKGVVSRVDVLLINASARFDPATQWSGTTSYSWGGAVAIDENRAYSFKAKLR